MILVQGCQNKLSLHKVFRINDPCVQGGQDGETLNIILTPNPQDQASYTPYF